jgi:hypothetical protein
MSRSLYLFAETVAKRAARLPVFVRQRLFTHLKTFSFQRVVCGELRVRELSAPRLENSHPVDQHLRVPSSCGKRE